MTSPNRLLQLTLIACAIGLLPGAPARSAERSLYLFGGMEHEVFLGCVTCYVSTVFSIWNADSDYGSPVRENSIWNPRGKYGSRYSAVSPWNPTATNPPIVVDRGGNLYGYFTRNRAHPRRITSIPPSDWPQTEDTRESFIYLAWLLDDYHLIIANLKDVRAAQAESEDPFGP